MAFLDSLWFLFVFFSESLTPFPAPQLQKSRAGKTAAALRCSI